MGRAALILAVVLTGCTHASAPTDPRTIWCDQNDPRRPTLAVIAAMSRPEIDEMNAHNRKGVAWCGWRP